jgi:chromosomal replication initiation ATPase DnaA
MSQMGLPFDWPAAETADNFIVTDANRAAVQHLESPGRWPVRASILSGPRKSGRSLLARIFAAQCGGQIIDDAEYHAEADIFHHWNIAQEERRPLLIVALERHAPWKPRLPDLASRIAITPVIHIEEPDDMLFGMLLDKLLGQRGLKVTPEVIAYVTARAERSYLGLTRLVDALDTVALSRKRGVTTPLAREVLEALGMMPVNRPLPNLLDE